MNIRSIQLRTAIVVASALLAVFGIAASIGLVLMTNYLHDGAQGIKETVNSIAASEELQIDLLDYNREQLLFDHSREQVHATRRDNAAERLQRGADSIERHVSSDAEGALVTEIQGFVREFVAARKDADSSQDAVLAYTSRSANVDDISTHLRKLISMNQDQAQALYARMDRQNSMADILGFGIMGALLAIVFALGLGLRSVVYRPLISLREALRKFGAGNNKTRAKLLGPQEWQEIAGVFNQMADNLERAQNDQLRFLAAIAHDLRNPLNAIRMSMDLVSSATSDDPVEMREMADIVLRQSEQLDRMVGDLLDRTRIESGDFELRLKEHDLRQLASHTIKLYQSTSTIHRFKLHLPDAPVLCRCDSTRIGQVLNNLVSNAVKYSPYGGVVTCHVARRDSLAIVTVSDQGMGISTEDRERIFEPFRRSKATRESIPGVGLGLAVSKRLIEAHGGKIEVESEAQSGSTFTVKIPVSEMTQFPEPDWGGAARQLDDPSATQPLHH